MDEQDDRARLERLYDAAVAGANPAPATAAAVSALAIAPGTRVVVIAIGKAARAMAAAACDALAARGIAAHDGLVVTHEGDSGTLACPAIVAVVVGDHPLPGAASLAASDALARLVERTRADDVAIVLVSGGASSLVAAPLPDSGIDQDELRALSARLLDSGADIARVNAERGRAYRWAAGRLAQALVPARVHCLVASDVPGDDPAVVGSGPCVAEPPVARATVRVVVGRDAAIDAAVAEAERAGAARVVRHREPLAGEAAELGRAVARSLLEARGRASRPELHLWAGEPTVALHGAREGATGGRMQELALAAAEQLAGAEGIVLLAAGTDGRDGPTDAAGAIVDGATWGRVRAEGGTDPGSALAGHDSHRALDAACALLRTGATGVNAADVVIALVRPPAG